MRIPHPKQNRDPSYPPHYAIFGRTKGGIFKSCPRVPKLWVWLLRGWGICLKVTLQTYAPENFRSFCWGDEQTVKPAQTLSEDPHRLERIFFTNFSNESEQPTQTRQRFHFTGNVFLSFCQVGNFTWNWAELALLLLFPYPNPTRPDTATRNSFKTAFYSKTGFLTMIN